MVATPPSSRLARRFLLVAPMCVAVPAFLLAAASWWLTAPLDENIPTYDPASIRVPLPGPDLSGSPAVPTEPDPEPEALAEWPEDRLDGPAAKRYLLAFMEQAVRRLEAVEGYTATLTRQERIGGELNPEQRLKIKIQHEPFAVYLRFESPRAGKEALYHHGRFDNHVLAHNGDWTRRLIPRLKLDPEGAIALADNRHPITEAGLLHLSRQLLHFRKLDLDDPHAETILDRTTDEDGTPWYRSIHTHDVNDGLRPFSYVEIRYSPELLLPLHIVSHDWPRPGEASEAPPLAERYHYSDLELDPEFSALEFDPSNPEYEFQRY